jgi:vacuolar-type H+-ATPase subunit I/STV1
MVRNRVIIVLGIVVLFLFTSLGLIFNLYQSEKAERKRYNDNYTAVLMDKARQQELTAKELQKLYPKYDSLANELKIKTKQITNIIETRYRFKDSIVTTTVLEKDVISEKSYFKIKEKCYDLSGYIKKDSITFTNKEFKDNLTTFLYKDYERKYLWGLFKFKPHYTAKVYSDCMKDTVSVLNNIKIKK